MAFSNSLQMTEPNNELSTESPQQQLTSKIQSFDYTVLTPEVRDLVQNKTSELKGLMRRSAQDIIDIGQKLIEVKEQLGHGNFSTWLKAEFDWSARTAARFMQVASQFKSANLANLNIAVSALYLLAEPSTSEKARQKTLELAEKGENITYSKTKGNVSRYQEQVQPSDFNSATKVTEDNSLAPFEQCEYLQTHSQLESKDQTNLIATGLSVETIPTIECDKTLEQNTIQKMNDSSKEKSEGMAELLPELSNHLHILKIEHKNSKLATNTAQSFDLTFAGIRIDFEGYPEVLIILFEQMQSNPNFTREILHKARNLCCKN